MFLQTLAPPSKEKTLRPGQISKSGPEGRSLCELTQVFRCAYELGRRVMCPVHFWHHFIKERKQPLHMLGGCTTLMGGGKGTLKSKTKQYKLILLIT